MGWKEKSQPFTFENVPIDGMFFLDGKLVAKGREGTGIEDYKFPIIVFPSGEHFDLWEHADPQDASLQLFGMINLPLFRPRAKALAAELDSRFRRCVPFRQWRFDTQR